MDASELTVAQLIASGDLLSPQKRFNHWLYLLRIFGTGVSYRPSLDEYVVRDPAHYLTPEMLALLNGLPVIDGHPKESLLNSEEFADRIVGTVMLPFIKGDEIWAVCRIFDKDMVDLLESEQMSTSPAVLLSGSKKLKTEDGKTLLIEDKPKFVDHIAICQNGVWDKGGDPNGIVQANIRGDSIMAGEKEMMKEDAKKDSDMESETKMDEKFDLLLKALDSIRSDVAGCNSRMDAYVKEKEEPEEKEDTKKDSEDEETKKDEGEEMEPTGAKRLAADKAKKDSEEEKVKADSIARQSKEIDELKKTIAGLSQLVRQPIPEMDRAALAGIQSRADSVRIQLGERAEQPLVGETPAAYRRRMAAALQKHSARWKKVKIDAVDDDTFQEVEGQIYADAMERAKSPNDIGPGRMREVTRHDPSGHVVTEFFGSEASIVQQFSRPTRRARVRDMSGVARQ